MAEDSEPSTPGGSGMSPEEASGDVVVVGGGVIGLSVAWRLAQRGLAVTVVDDDPAGGASRAAAGMLAPITEAHFGEEALTAFNLESARRWPAFAGEVEEASGFPVGYRTEGTLAVAFDADDLRVLTQLRAYHDRLGLGGERLRGRECRAREPLLSPQIRGGILVESDHQVDTRALTAAVLVAAERAGVRLVRRRAARLDVADGEVAGVTVDSGDTLRAPVTVLAAGCWSGGLPGLPTEVRPPVRPVKGQILRLAASDPAAPRLTCTVRALRRGRSVYIVPRADGRVVVGATCEERGFDTRVTAGGVRELLEDATEVIPAVGELELIETLARLRPGTPDNGPILGPTALPGLIMATGHYRNGILLTPLTADVITEVVLDGCLPPLAAPFSPGRFAGALV